MLLGLRVRAGCDTAAVGCPVAAVGRAATAPAFATCVPGLGCCSLNRAWERPCLDRSGLAPAGLGEAASLARAVTAVGLPGNGVGLGAILLPSLPAALDRNPTETEWPKILTAAGEATLDPCLAATVAGTAEAKAAATAVGLKGLAAGEAAPHPGLNAAGEATLDPGLAAAAPRDPRAALSLGGTS